MAHPPTITLTILRTRATIFELVPLAGTVATVVVHNTTILLTDTPAITLAIRRTGPAIFELVPLTSTVSTILGRSGAGSIGTNLAAGTLAVGRTSGAVFAVATGVIATSGRTTLAGSVVAGLARATLTILGTTGAVFTLRCIAGTVPTVGW